MVTGGEARAEIRNPSSSARKRGRKRNAIYLEVVVRGPKKCFKCKKCSLNSRTQSGAPVCDDIEPPAHVTHPVKEPEPTEHRSVAFEEHVREQFGLVFRGQQQLFGMLENFTKFRDLPSQTTSGGNSKAAEDDPVVDKHGIAGDVDGTKKVFVSGPSVSNMNAVCEPLKETADKGDGDIVAPEQDGLMVNDDMDSDEDNSEYIKKLGVALSMTPRIEYSASGMKRASGRVRKNCPVVQMRKPMVVAPPSTSSKPFCRLRK